MGRGCRRKGRRSERRRFEGVNVDEEMVMLATEVDTTRSREEAKRGKS